MHDKGQVGFALGRQHAGRSKTGVIDEQRVFVACPLDGVRRIRHNEFKRLIIPMLGGCQGILAGHIKFVKADVMEKHINAAEVVSRDVDFLPVEAVTDGLFAQNFLRLQEQGT